ncbi:MAG: PAS domain-containing protein [Bacteroidales bacterium]|nr:PAS domain-containing protein [Bacteroidales bacterium]MCF8404681.1 PAS domain-containing protein [Bacteroidales bacterium]
MDIKEKYTILKAELNEKDALIKDLKENKRLYEQITKDTDDLIAIATFNINPKYIYTSPSHLRKLGYEDDDLIGKPAFDFIHPDDKPFLLGILKRYLEYKLKNLFNKNEEEYTEKLEFRIKNKKNEWQYIESLAKLLKGNRILFISRNITDRKLAEIKLTESEKQLRTIFENSGTGIFIHDQSGEILELNQVFQEMIDADKPEIIGKDIKEIFPDINNNSANVKTLASISGKQNIYHFKKKDSSLLALEIFSNNISLQEKNVVLSTVIDVTEREKALEDLRKNIFRSEFLASNAMELAQMELVENIYSYSIEKIYRLLNEEVIVLAVEFFENNNWKVKDVIGIKSLEVII